MWGLGILSNHLGLFSRKSHLNDCKHTSKESCCKLSLFHLISAHCHNFHCIGTTQCIHAKLPPHCNIYTNQPQETRLLVYFSGNFVNAAIVTS